MALKNISKWVAEGRYLAKEIQQSWNWQSRPQQLAFEINGACDARCIHCPREAMDRPKHPMDMVLFRRMIDEADELGIPELCPNGYGEAMLVKNLRDYFACIRSRRHRFKVILNTNGHLMDDDKIDVLIEAEVHMVNVTIDGATHETAKKVRVNLDTARIEDNIRRLIAKRDAQGLTRPKVRVGMVLINENRHEGSAFLEKWKGKVDYVGLSGFSSRVGSIDGQGSDGKCNSVKRCVLPFRDLNVWSDGRAVLCCEDWNEEYVVGDLNHQSLVEIWTGEPLRRARTAHLQGLGGDIALCARCNLWRAPRRGTRLRV